MAWDRKAPDTLVSDGLGDTVASCIDIAAFPPLAFFLSFFLSFFFLHVSTCVSTQSYCPSRPLVRDAAHLRLCPCLPPHRYFCPCPALSCPPPHLCPCPFVHAPVPALPPLVLRARPCDSVRTSIFTPHTHTHRHPPSLSLVALRLTTPRPASPRLAPSRPVSPRLAPSRPASPRLAPPRPAPLRSVPARPYPPSADSPAAPSGALPFQITTSTWLFARCATSPSAAPLHGQYDWVETQVDM